MERIKTTEGLIEVSSSIEEDEKENAELTAISKILYHYWIDTENKGEFLAVEVGSLKIRGKDVSEQKAKLYQYAYLSSIIKDLFWFSVHNELGLWAIDDNIGVRRNAEGRVVVVINIRDKRSRISGLGFLGGGDLSRMLKYFLEMNMRQECGDPNSDCSVCSSSEKEKDKPVH
ncbi:MAG: hypothetical protein ABH887_02070 [bacterium]